MPKELPGTRHKHPTRGERRNPTAGRMLFRREQDDIIPLISIATPAPTIRLIFRQYGSRRRNSSFCLAGRSTLLALKGLRHRAGLQFVTEYVDMIFFDVSWRCRRLSGTDGRGLRVFLGPEGVPNPRLTVMVPCLRQFPGGGLSTL